METKEAIQSFPSCHLRRGEAKLILIIVNFLTQFPRMSLCLFGLSLKAPRGSNAADSMLYGAELTVRSWRLLVLDMVTGDKAVRIF